MSEIKPPPDDLIERFKILCREQDAGMSCLVTDVFGLILWGDSEVHPNDIAIMAAHRLLEGVVSGMWVEANEKAKEEEKERIM